MEPSLPANYVTLSQLKERYLKEKERERKEKEEEEERKKKEEEEELRQRKIREQEARLPKADGVVFVRNRWRRFDQKEFGPVERSVVSECEVEKKSEEPEEKRWKKKNFKTKKEEVRSEEASNGLGRNGGERRRAGGVEIRAKSNNVEEVEAKFRDLGMGGETEIGDDRLSRNVGAKEEIEPKDNSNDRQRRPNNRNGGDSAVIESKDRDFGVNVEAERRGDRRRRPIRGKGGTGKEVEPKGRDLGMNGEAERGNDRRRRPIHGKGDVGEGVVPKGWVFERNGETERRNDRWRRPNCKNGGASEENVVQVRELSVNDETERGIDKLKETQETEAKVRALPKDGESERADRLRELNSKEIEPKVRGLAVTGESGGGEDRLWKLKGKNVGGKDETSPKVMGSLVVKAESEREYERLRRPSRYGYSSDGKTWWHGKAWIKKGEVSHGNVSGIQSME